VEDCNQYKDYSFSCHATFSTVSADSILNSTNMAGVGLVGAAALAYYISRKRRAATIDLTQEERLATDSSSTGFEMMSDSAVRV
jgi:hypothetical protein